MGSSFIRLGKTAIREGFEQISKQLTKEQPNVAGKMLGGLDNATKNLLSKEIAEYPPAAETLKDIMRNHPEDFHPYLRELKGQKVNKQTAAGIQEIANKANKPEVAAKAAAVADQLPEPPPVHNLTAETEEAWKKEVLVPWITKNQAQIRENKLLIDPKSKLTEGQQF